MIKFLKLWVLLSFSILSLNASADIKDDLDSMLGIGWGSVTFTSSSSLTPSDIASTSRIATQFGGMRLRSPVKNFNLLSFSPPSLSSGCNGIDLTLGSFSMVSKDELISLFRSIASNALSYGFGQAIHAMCPPCWSGMQTIQKKISELNQHARNTCAIAKTLVEGGKDIVLNDSTCVETAWAGTGDFFECTEGASAERTEEREKEWDKILAIQSIGGEPKSHFSKGNAVATAFENHGVAEFTIDSVVTNWIFGRGLSSTEVAMNLFGYKNNTPDDTNALPSGFTEPMVNDLEKFFNPPEADASRHEFSVTVCADATGTPNINYPCGKPYTVRISDQEMILDKVSREIRELFTHMSNPAPLSGIGLSPLQIHIINYIEPEMARTIFLGDRGNIKRMNKMAHHFAKIISKKTVAMYLQTVVNLTSEVFAEASRSSENLGSVLANSWENIDEVKQFITTLNYNIEEDIQDLETIPAYQKALDEFSHSFGEAVATRIRNRG